MSKLRAAANLVVSAGALAIAMTLAMCAPARAQSAVVVSACGTPPVTYVAGFTRALTQNTSGLACTSASGGGGGGTSSSFNAAFPASGTAIGVKNGANMVNLNADGSGNLLAAINAALPAGTAQIGHVVLDTGSTTVVTGNVTVVQPTGTNLHAVLDTTSTTAVTQATAANLNATVVGTGTFATQSAVTAASGSYASGSIANGADVTLGNNTDAASCASGTSHIACERQLHTDMTGSIPAGTNVIGHVIADSGSTTVVTGTTTVQTAGNSYSNLTTAATTTVKSGAGVLHTLCVNALGTVASTAIVYDNTAGSGTKIATVNTLAVLGCQTYDVAFATGLTLVTTGTVAPDITLSYR